MKMNTLMKEYKHIEWLAYLLGKKKSEAYFVDDIYIPEQTVTPGDVENIICPEYNNLPIIGVIHSHHGMGTGFSGTDHEFVNDNHDISIVIAHGKIAGQARWQTPCGALKILPVKIKPVYELDFNEEGFLEAVKDKITIYQLHKKNEKSTFKDIVGVDEEKYIEEFNENYKYDDDEELIFALKAIDLDE